MSGAHQRLTPIEEILDHVFVSLARTNDATDTKHQVQTSQEDMIRRGIQRVWRTVADEVEFGAKDGKVNDGQKPMDCF